MSVEALSVSEKYAPERWDVFFDMNKLKFYQDILDVVLTEPEHKGNSTLVNIKTQLRGLIQGEELCGMFGIDIKDIATHPVHYKKLSEHQRLVFMDGENRKIAWPDDGRQPKDEWLYVISFPTGAYIFGRDYPIKTFEAFFQELRQYSPKYTDSKNKALYYTPDKTRDVHDAFSEILGRHRNDVDKELKEIKKQKLREELAALDKE